jgi:general secretion pathway protein G
MAHDWKKFRTQRQEGRENPDTPLVTLYQRFKPYEKRVALALGCILVLIWGVRLCSRVHFRGSDPIAAAHAALDNLVFALQIMGKDTGRFPTNGEGLEALVAKPAGIAGDQWRGPYLDKVPLDPWGQKFAYTGQKGAFSLTSSGPDGRAGTPDDLVITYPPEGASGQPAEAGK